MQWSPGISRCNSWLAAPNNPRPCSSKSALHHPTSRSLNLVKRTEAGLIPDGAQGVSGGRGFRWNRSLGFGEVADRNLFLGICGRCGALKRVRVRVRVRGGGGGETCDVDGMIEESAGWVAPRAVIAMVLLIVASTLALFYGRSLCSLVASAPAVAWLLSRGEDSGKKKRAPDGRAHGLEDAIGRRWARAEFYRTHPNFDHNCPPVGRLMKPSHLCPVNRT
jgi:hypothetical protein